MSTIRKHRLSIAALDAAVTFAVVGALVFTALVMYRGGAGIFPGGNEGRVVFAALAAALVAYGVNSTLEDLVGPSRENLRDAIRELLVEAARAALRDFVDAAAADQYRPDALRLSTLRAAAFRAHWQALNAGAEPDDIHL
ncbi:hypothetical protein AB0C95_01255 [Streptomyces caniferus]|uniref:hypothetical protein n=1 Tax=Streptomyces caniferus TaxID=285557 RepID=UPI0033C83B74